MNKLNIILIIVIAALLSVAIIFYNQSKKSKSNFKEQVELYNAISDTLKTWKNKDSLNVAKIQVMQTDKKSDFLTIKNLTGNNLELQKLIKNKDKKIQDLNTALILESETHYTDTIKQYYPIGGDTLIFSQSVLLDTINNEWINSIYGFNKGFSYFDLKVKNKYSLIIGYEGKTLFKQGIPYAIVTNLNPYTTTSDLRVYQVSVPKQKRFGISFQTGFGGIYNLRTNNIGYGPYVGLGINYNIILW